LSPARTIGAIAGASALTISAALVSSGTAYADTLAPKTTFTMVVNQADGTTNVPTDGESVPNIDSVKSTIRAYYNASGGISNKTSSRYINEVRKLEHHILSSLPATAPANAALVFDVDDTLLWNYDFEDNATNFNFDPTLNNTWVTGHLFPAVPGMPEMLADLLDRGYEIYGITGRGASQETDTIANLTEKGFTDDATPGGTPIFDASNTYTKGATIAGPPATLTGQPWVDCSLDGTNTSCSTVEYKAETRDHIETTDGVNIVMNVGDQWSDLQGGFADDYTKIPNPTYFLASPNITGHPASDVNMVPPTSYVMAPDGSSGYSVASGDDIPNADPARKLIRAYYNADSTGISNKATSPYITQMNSLTGAWTGTLTSDCTKASQAHNSAVQAQTAAKQAVTDAEAQVAKDTKAVAKAKKKLKKAHTAKAKAKAKKKLKKANKALKASEAALAAAQDKLDGITVPATPAAVFDADDTTLWNYDLEDNVMKFVFDPAKQQIWITGHLMPAVPGMVALVKAAAGAGCAIFGLTGRPLSQQADTIANLTEKGYVDGAGKPLFTGEQFYTKGAVVTTGGISSIPTQPWVDCSADGNRANCSTIEYKGDTRAHIEDQGFRIVGNFGDQFSDLIGGHADHTYKIPNPTYYLP
jgi:hypothetical protein